jgi:hypothetical protein
LVKRPPCLQGPFLLPKSEVPNPIEANTTRIDNQHTTFFLKKL